MSAHDDFLASCRATGLTVFDGKTASPLPAAYVLVTRLNPRALERAMTRDRHGRELRWRLTVASNAPSGVASMVDRLAALDGSRAGGERVEEIENNLGIDQDSSVIIQGAPAWFTKIEFRVSQPI